MLYQRLYVGIEASDCGQSTDVRIGQQPPPAFGSVSRSHARLRCKVLDLYVDKSSRQSAVDPLCCVKSLVLVFDSEQRSLVSRVAQLERPNNLQVRSELLWPACKPFVSICNFLKVPPS